MRRPARLLLPFALAAAVAACGDEPGPAINEGPLRHAFEDASAETGVPTDLLLAIGYHETRWVHVMPDVAADPNAEGGHGEVDDGFQGAFGIMQLAQRPDHDTLDLAANLAGKTPDELKKDPALNVLGAALVLRRYADEMYAGVDIEQMDLFAWRDVVARWSGIDDPNLAYEAADEVYAILRDGAGRTLESGEILELMPNPGLANAEDGTVAPSESGIWGRSQDGLGYGSAHWNPAASSNYTDGRGGNSVRYIVIHTMQGGYAGSISWFKNPAAKVSAHYCVRSHDGDITQMVDENDTAWHAGNWSYNQQSIGIEHEGFIADGSWYTDAMYRASARLSCDIARRHHIPVDRQHIIGHIEVPGSTHTDPGRYWNWDYYMSLVRACVGGGGSPADNPNQGGGGSSGGGGTVHPGNGTLQGVVYADGDLNHRVGGASIRLSNGLTATAASNGYWSLSVPAGNYSVTASASGYSTGSVSRTVTAGGQVWASVNLSKGASVSPGRLAGIVFEAGDSSRRIAGATVSAAGRSTTTDANGRYSMDVPPGTPTVQVSASGYLGKTLGATIRAGQTTTVNVGLVGKAASGTASVVGVVYELPDDHNRIANASVSISNGSESHRATADGAGYFEFRNLPVGTWRVTATAAGWGTGSHSVYAAAGSKMWGSVGLTRPGAGGTNTGAADGELIGVVYESPDSMKRISGATVSLSTGQRVVTGSDGVYRIRAHGTVTAVATAPGYAPKSVSRVVSAGAQTWGSIGLTKGGSQGSDLMKECKPTQPATLHVPDHDALPVNPLKGEIVTTTPTLEFTGVGDPTASYIVRLVPNDKNAPMIEWKEGPGEQHRVTPPKPLAKDVYAWTVVPLWPDCKTADPAKWGFFVVE